MEDLPQEREMLSLPKVEGSSTGEAAQAEEGAEHLSRDKPPALVQTDQSTEISGASHTPKYSS